MKHLNFDKNYNNKLHGYFITTFRSTASVEEKNLSRGSIVRLEFNHEPFAIAKVVEYIRFDLDNFHNYTPALLRAIFCIDTSLDYAQAMEEIRSMCGHKVTFLLLEVIEHIQTD